LADLVHGDLSTDNILVRGGRIVGVIDVEAVGCGTRVSDLACVVREGYMSRGDEAALERLLTAGLAIAGAGALLICIAATRFPGLGFRPGQLPRRMAPCSIRGFGAGKDPRRNLSRLGPRTSRHRRTRRERDPAIRGIDIHRHGRVFFGIRPASFVAAKLNLLSSQHLLDGLATNAHLTSDVGLG
jgi:hypothetical protein